MKDKFYYSDGSTSSEWDSSKLRHRVDGPAEEYSNGTTLWAFNGKTHRVNGPAIEYSDGAKEWWVDGIEYDEEDFNNKIKEVNEMCLVLQLTDPREWVRELGKIKSQGESK